ncbi:hypothetical protein PTTG_27040 [Puccinia triticina 1-1 BBBD Race 1]|uniref:Uncharacterized protein n=1 Tax=Puccinia triticina (isolate 1-1 / race 1 (BBBD)) TaxID=630390 RepID=A0A180GNX9_PUCT1|nr:hypothetical protein PTTG_27040 [Puccinia triticina 1-1 BBBD Race 1]
MPQNAPTTPISALKLPSNHLALKITSSERLQLPNFTPEEPQVPLGSYTMNSQENAQLIQYYLKLLRLRKEASLRDYQPTSWEQLTPKEQIILAAYHAHIRKEEDLDTLLKIQRYRQEAKAKKKAFYDAEYRAKMSASIAAETTVDNPTPAPTASTADKTPTNQLVPNYKGHSHLQRELAAAKELQDRVKRMQVTTIARKDLMPATPASTPAPSEIPPPSKDGPCPTEPNKSAMEIDEIDKLCPTSLAPICTRPITPEIKTLSKEEQIKLRAIPSNRKQWCNSRAASFAHYGSRIPEGSPETHGEPQDRSSCQRLESLGSRELPLPSSAKKQVMKFKKIEGGKNRSLSSSLINFDDPARWKRTADLLQIAANLYKNID